MRFDKLIAKDIFPIEITEGKNCGKWIVYMPLVNHAEIVALEILKLMEDCMDGTVSIKDENIDKAEEILNRLHDGRRRIYYTSHSVDGLLNLMILPNNMCNFRCSYCYSAQGRSNVEIPLDMLKAGIRYFFNPERAKGERLTVSVLGGGEPLLSWNILKQALEYACEMNSLRGTGILPVSIVTNGSIINDDILQFCRQHKISLSVSFDILEDVQNSQRDKYELVRDNINRFTGSGIDVAINTVITRDNVNRMEEMIETARMTIPKTNKIGLKPIMSGVYFPDMESRQQYYHDFVDNFFAAKRPANRYGIYLTCSYLNASLCLADRYCPGKFVITAEGTISVCHCVSSGSEPLYNEFIFGSISDEGEVIINHNKLEDILSSDVHHHERCAACFAKWHCAGGCYADSCHINENERRAYCESMRRFLSLYLQEYFNLKT